MSSAEHPAWSSLPHTLALAWQEYRAGRWQQAEQLCRQILEVAPSQVDALYALGLSAWQTGRASLAVDYLQTAVRLKPDFAEALNDLGMALQDQGNLAEAVLRYQQAVEAKPHLGPAHNNLGSLLRRQGKLTEAVSSFQKALRLLPASAEVHYNLANALKDQGQVAEAVAHYQEAIRLRPDFAGSHHNLGVALQEQGRLSEAAACLHQALRLSPNLAKAHYNLGIVLQEQGSLAEAVACFQQAVRLRPDLSEAHNNLGIALLAQGEWAQAEASFEQALRINPEFAEARINRGMLWLLHGKFEQAWPEYEWRWQTKQFPSFPRPEPLWDGRSLEGKTILLYTEQGVGDTLHFIRYAAVVKERGATVVVGCPSELLGVLAGCPGVDCVLPLDGPLPACDLRAPLLSLPGLCGTTLSTIPAQVPYLVADRARATFWRKRFASTSGFKVGICWQGSPRHRDDRRRSVLLSQFAHLANIPGVRLASLQRGPGQEQWENVAEHWPVVDLPGLGPEPSEAWVETAALVGALDLVVTVDTALAHLAGALGVPVWVALPFSPDWRWLLGRADSPWYPTMRLFRQTRYGQWADVFERIAEQLQKVAAEKPAFQGSSEATPPSSSSS